MKLFLTLISFVILSFSAQAASFKLETSGSEPLYQTTLTKEVYQYSSKNDLNDLTIINATGESVPYALLAYEDIHPHQVTEKSEPLVIFPMLKDALNPSGVNIQLNNHGTDTRVNVTSEDTKAVAKTYYLFDLGKKHAAFKKLILDWQGQEGKLITVDVLMSNNLKDWSLAGQGTILKVSTNEQAIIQNSIMLDNVMTSRYLQILPKDSTDEFKLTSVNVEFNQEHAITQSKLWQEVTFLNRQQSNTETHIDFSSPSKLPATLLKISLPQKNTITQAAVFTRDNKEQPWRRITIASLYRLNKKGEDYLNQAINIPPTTARYWRLSFNQASGGIGKDNPTLSLGWLPETIVWNARGSGPFNLQVGETNNNTNHVPIAQLIKPYDTKKVGQLPKANLSLASSVQQFNAWDSPPDYKRFWLWGGLALGVLALVLMAYSLLKNNAKP
jgi:hypothetical protein